MSKKISTLKYSDHVKNMVKVVGASKTFKKELKRWK